MFRSRNELDRSISSLDQAILRDPKNALAYADRGEVWRLKGNFDQSMADLDKAVALDPKSPVALTLRGDTLLAKGELERAIVDYDEANHFVSDYVAAVVGRALVLEARRDATAAAAEFQRALKLPPEADAEKSRPAQAIAKQHLAAIQVQLEAAEKAKDLKADDANQADHLRTLQAEAKAKDIEASAELKAKAIQVAAEARIAALERDVAEKVKALKAAEPPPPPNQGYRAALVIGNSAYRSVNLLVNPRRDAEGVANTLRTVGFDSVTLVQDATLAQFKKALRDFQDVADRSDWAVVYYAGHGIEIGGQNYLIPTDARLATDRDADDEAVSLQSVLAKIQKARKLRLVILDACRENPYQRVMKREITTRAITRGLAPFEPTRSDEIVVFAAKDGEWGRGRRRDGPQPVRRRAYQSTADVEDGDQSRVSLRNVRRHACDR